MIVYVVTIIMFILMIHTENSGFNACQNKEQLL